MATLGHRLQRLRSAARAIPTPGDRVAGGAVLVRSSGGLFAAMPMEVSRAEYAQFAKATGRPDTLCRERLSPLRIVAPRSWRAPGFDQTDAQPSGQVKNVLLNGGDANPGQIVNARTEDLDG